MNAELATSTLRQTRTTNRSAIHFRFHASEQGQSSPSPRKQLIAAFREIGAGVDEKTAGARTRDWYRSSGADWTRGLV
jgi:hypothetical protein